MHHKLSALLLIVGTLLFTACGDITTTIEESQETTGPLTISGKIEYERIQPLHSRGSTSLNSNDITNESAKRVIIEAVNSRGTAIANTSTDDNGNYQLKNMPETTNLKIRVYAKMLKTSGWDVKVIDNTNGNALYVMEGSMTNTGSTDSIRNLRATANNKISPPFAILDSIYLAMKKVLVADSSVIFPPLKMNWSVNNIESGTYYDGNDNIMIQGDQQGDSDEYDGHIMIHEWGHYFEAKFSRADSIGGQHGTGDHLDIRLAFGEGWGNALSAMVTDDPLYYDTMKSNNIDRGWNMNIETAAQETPGWFSEASIQRILYDLYDSNDDGADTLSLGFKPLYDLLIGKQKETKAFTSLFSFITELKNENSSNSTEIDDIVSDENIETINDIYGENRLNNLENITLPIYNDINVNSTLSNICTSNTYGVSNKLNNHRLIRFTINETRAYTIKVLQNNGDRSDPDFVIYNTSPFKQITLDEASIRGVEEATHNLVEGEYLLDIYDDQNSGLACFNITIN